MIATRRSRHHGHAVTASGGPRSARAPGGPGTWYQTTHFGHVDTRPPPRPRSAKWTP